MRVLCSECEYGELANLQGNRYYCKLYKSAVGPVIGCDGGIPKVKIEDLPMGKFKDEGTDIQTNGDVVRHMDNNDINIWFWWMLKYSQNFTDSNLAVKEWLDKPFEREQ